MKQIKLTQEQHALVDNADFVWLNQWKWSARLDPNFKAKKTFYAERGIYLGIVDGKYKTKSIKMHRLIMGIGHGIKKEVDHINGNTLDNRRCNLRICNRRQNCRNMSIKITNTSGYIGIDWLPWSRKWRARITLKNGKRKSLGCFLTKKEAAEAYNNGAKFYYKKYAKLNTI